jgi:hypothetical protein
MSKAEDCPFGQYEMVTFRSFQERLVFIAVKQIFLSLRLEAVHPRHNAQQAAMWFIILWRAFRFTGTDSEMEADKHLGRIGNNFVVNDVV